MDKFNLLGLENLFSYFLLYSQHGLRGLGKCFLHLFFLLCFSLSLSGLAFASDYLNNQEQRYILQASHSYPVVYQETFEILKKDVSKLESQKQKEQQEEFVVQVITAVLVILLLRYAFGVLKGMKKRNKENS